MLPQILLVAQTEGNCVVDMIFNKTVTDRDLPIVWIFIFLASPGRPCIDVNRIHSNESQIK